MDKIIANFLKIHLFVLLLTGLLSGAGCMSRDSETTLLTYNIQIGRGMERLDSKIENAAQLVRSIGADTVVLNEVDINAERTNYVNQPEVMAKIGKYNYFFGISSLKSDSRCGNVIMSKYPMERISLLEMPDNGFVPRSALVVKVFAPEPYYVIAAHLISDDGDWAEQKRVESIEQLFAFIQDRELAPVILMGDLNANRDSLTLNCLRQKGFFVINDLDPAANSWPADHPEILLDYIAVYPAESAECLEYYVVDDDHTSDHRPVYGKLRFHSRECCNPVE